MATGTINANGIGDIKRPGTKTSITLPYAVSRAGFFRIMINAGKTGYIYVNTDDSSLYVTKGTAAGAQVYEFFVPKGKTLSLTGSDLTAGSEYNLYFIPLSVN